MSRARMGPFLLGFSAPSRCWKAAKGLAQLLLLDRPRWISKEGKVMPENKQHEVAALHHEMAALKKRVEALEARVTELERELRETQEAASAD